MTVENGGVNRLPVPTGVIGMIHVLPLPGAPLWGGSMGPVLDRVRRDAAALAAGGVDALLVENFGDVPFHPASLPPETVAGLTMAALAASREAGLPFGVNALRNDARAALAVAAATGAAFIRINVHTGVMATDQGWIEGRADETIRQRARLAPGVAVLADVLVKHATAPAGLTLARAASDAWHRGLADGLIVSGAGTGEATSLEDVEEVRRAVPTAPVLAGSGVTEDTVAPILDRAHAVIVGTAFEEGGRPGAPVDPARVRRLVEAARRERPA